MTRRIATQGNARSGVSPPGMDGPGLPGLRVVLHGPPRRQHSYSRKDGRRMAPYCAVKPAQALRSQVPLGLPHHGPLRRHPCSNKPGRRRAASGRPRYRVSWRSSVQSGTPRGASAPIFPRFDTATCRSASLAMATSGRPTRRLPRAASAATVLRQSSATRRPAARRGAGLRRAGPCDLVHRFVGLTTGRYGGIFPRGPAASRIAGRRIETLGPVGHPDAFRGTASCCPARAAPAATFPSSSSRSGARYSWVQPGPALLGSARLAWPRLGGVLHGPLRRHFFDRLEVHD